MPNSHLQQIAWELEATHRVVATVARLLARELDSPVDNWEQLMVIRQIQRVDETTVGRLAMDRRTSRQSMAKAVATLEGKGLVQTSPNPHHRRSKLVSLTEAGQRHCRESDEAVCRVHNHVIDHFQLEQMVELRDWLREFRVAMQMRIRCKPSSCDRPTCPYPNPCTSDETLGQPA